MKFYLKLVLILTFAVLSGCQTTGSNDKLTSKPPEEFTKDGLAAAKSQNWRESIKAFEKTYDAAGPSPTAAFNLGLAHASAGDLINASAWFEAYLAMVPDAPNSPQIRNEIKRLDGLSRKRVKDLFFRARKAAERLPDLPTANEFAQPEKSKVINWVSYTALSAGLFDFSKETHAQAAVLGTRLGYAGKIYDRWESRHEQLVQAMAESGYFKGVWERIDLIKGDEMRKKFPEAALINLANFGFNDAAESAAKQAHVLFAWGYDPMKYAKGYLRKGQVNMARSYAREILNAGDSYDTKEARAYAILGNPQKALQLMRDADENGFQPYINEYVLADITGIFVQIGDIRSAKTAAALAKKRAPNSETAGGGRYTKLADAFIALAEGRTSRAISLIQSIDWDFVPPQFVTPAVPYSVRLGDLEGAEAITKLLALPKARPAYLNEIAAGYASRGDTENAGRVRSEADAIELKNGDGWKPADEKQRNIVTAWCTAARKLSYELWLVDLKTNLTIARTNPAEDIPSYLTNIAKAWAKGLYSLDAFRWAAGEMGT